MDRFDYVIVGGGAAGCVLAYRLTADPDVRVLVIEAGGPDRHPFIHMPKGIARVMADLRYIWPYMTEPEEATDGLAESWTRGRTLGGSSSINGMVYVRGQDADFNELARRAGDDWNWPRIGNAYRELEAHELGPAATRGDRGPLRISMPPERPPLMEAAIAAGQTMGLERKQDVNDPEDCERIGYAPRTIWKGRRQSAATAFLKPALKRPNLTVVTGVAVDRVLFDGRRAVGITGSRVGEAVEYRAEREVILCAGALSSPAILQRSGVGPADHLRSLGINVRHDSPEVGENVREHRGFVMQWRVRDALSWNHHFRGVRLFGNALRYFLTHGGPLAGSAYEVGGWLRSHGDAGRPDMQILVAPFSFD
ncbi:MAG: GMC family oxidoreductase N-terminal domain-containing protein, partial [Sphingomonadales bacterium]